MAEKIAGILGGMGPEATVDLMERIIRLTPALDDCDHIHCVVDNNPKVPSRIKAIIEGGGNDPGPVMADMGRRLERFGADFLAIACNTAHHYYDAVQEAVNIPVIHAIEQVTKHILQQYPNATRIGVLASPAVAMTRLYSTSFEQHGLLDIWPTQGNQDTLLEVIKAVKRGETTERVRNAYKMVAASLSENNVQILVIACTELSVLNEDLSIPTVDAAEILARKIVSMAKNFPDID